MVLNYLTDNPNAVCPSKDLVEILQLDNYAMKSVLENFFGLSKWLGPEVIRGRIKDG